MGNLYEVILKIDMRMHSNGCKLNKTTYREVLDHEE